MRTSSGLTSLNSQSFPPSTGSLDSGSNSRLSFVKAESCDLHDLRSSPRGTCSGHLKKKGTWIGFWKEFFYLLESDLLLEFTRKGSRKPRRVYELNKYGVRLASKLCGQANTFGLFSLKESRDPIYFLCSDATSLQVWMRAIGRACGKNLDEASPTSSTDFAEKHSSSTETFLEALNDGAVLSNSTGIIIAVNQAFCTAFHYQHSELINRPVTVLMEPAMAKHHDSFIKRYMERGFGDFIGTARVQRVRNGLGVVGDAEISLGEMQRGGEIYFLARFRPLNPQQAEKRRTRKKRRSASLHGLQSLSTSSESEDEELLNARTRITQMVCRVLAASNQQMSNTFGGELQALLNELAEERATAQKNERLIAALKSPHFTTKLPCTSVGSMPAMTTQSPARGSQDGTGGSGSAPSFTTTSFVQPTLVIDRSTPYFGPVISTAPGRATVLCARVDGWQCACKELYLEDLDDERIQSFEDEIRTLISLPHHRNLVQYLFHQRSAKTVRVFMSRYDTSLDQILQQWRAERKQLSRRDVIHFVMEISRGLAILHRAGIVHCDLQPANIFANLDASGDVQRLVVGDFDAAKRVGRLKAEQKEQLFTDDMRALGLILYELLTGVAPDPSASSLSINFERLHPTLCSLVEVFNQLVAPNPADRPDIVALNRLLAAEFLAQ